ncbi:MAG: putative lipid II flippase FtsW [Candidatus Firestonebacteria bacterium]
MDLTAPRKRYDGGVILSALVILLAFGIVMVFSSSGIYANDKYKTLHYFLMKQLFWIGVGSLGLIFFRNLKYEKLRELAKPLFILAVISVFLVFVPHLGKKVGGARRWIWLFGFTFEPSEFLKLAFILYVATAIERKQEIIRNFANGFMPFLIIFMCISGVMILQPDMGSIIMLLLVLGLMLFVGGVRLAHVLAVSLPMLPIGYMVIMKASYRSKRIKAFLDPWSDPQGIGFQMVQSFIAFGSGGIFGKGLGNGTQKLFYLPEAHTDFIFAIVGEEVGLIGATAVLLVFGFIIWKGIDIAMRLEDIFGKVLAVGITSWIGLQAFINMSVVTGLVPTKGLTLPFISYGGSSLLINMMAVGILLNLAKQVRR